MTATLIDPAKAVRRPPLWRHQQALGARFEAVDGTGAIAADYGGDPEADKRQLTQLALVDLTPLPRLGLKGAGLAAWADARDVPLPPEPNQARGGVLRLAANEILLIPEPVSEPWPEAWAAPEPGPPHPVPRRDGSLWLRLTGALAPQVLATLCAVDLAPDRFGDGQVAQTLLARMASIIARADIAVPDGGAILAYHLFADIAASDYLWGVLLDAIGDRGRPVGFTALERVMLDGLENP